MKGAVKGLDLDAHTNLCLPHLNTQQSHCTEMAQEHGGVSHPLGSKSSVIRK